MVVKNKVIHDGCPSFAYLDLNFGNCLAKNTQQSSKHATPSTVLVGSCIVNQTAKVQITNPIMLSCQ